MLFMLNSVEYLKNTFEDFDENCRAFKELTKDGGLDYAAVVLDSGHRVEDVILLKWYFRNDRWLQKLPNGKTFGVCR